MAKKFKFKLEGLLKLRHFKEEQLKVELGKINQEILQVKKKINDLKEHIDETYQSQEKAFANGSDGQFAKFFPYYIQAKREDIENQENLLFSLQKRYERKLVEVSKAMGESKVIHQMKDKGKESWKKEVEKKEQSEIDELLSMRRTFKEMNS